MKKATDNLDGLISPAGALELWREVLPGAPPDGQALLARSERGTGPPVVLYKGPGAPPSGRRYYDPAKVWRWLLDQLPPEMQAAWRLYTYVLEMRLTKRFSAEQLHEAMRGEA